MTADDNLIAIGGPPLIDNGDMAEIARRVNAYNPMHWLLVLLGVVLSFLAGIGVMSLCAGRDRGPMIHWWWLLVEWGALSLSIFVLAWLLASLHRDERIRLRAMLGKLHRTVIKEVSQYTDRVGDVLDEAREVLKR